VSSPKTAKIVFSKHAILSYTRQYSSEVTYTNEARIAMKQLYANLKAKEKAEKHEQEFVEYCCFTIQEANTRNHHHCLDGLIEVSKNPKGNSVLHTAVMLRNFEIIKNLILLKGYNPNILNAEGQTPLHFACNNASLREVLLLLDLGSDPSIKDQLDQNALHWTVITPQSIYDEENDANKLRSSRDIFEEIYHVNTSLIQQQNHDGFNPCHLALINNYVNVANFLVDTEANLEQLTKLSGENIFHLAAKNPSFNRFLIKLFSMPFYERLLDRKYSCLPEFEGNLPIHLAASEGNINALGLFCDSDPKSIDSTNYEGTTPLMFAITNIQLDAAMALVEMGAWIDAEDDNQWRALHFAVCLDRNLDPEIHLEGKIIDIIPPITKYLIRHSGDINAKVDLGNSPLSLACIHSSFEVVQELVDRGANVNSYNDMGYTPLHFSVERGDIKMTTYLISKGSQVNRRSAEGETPLHLAMSQDHWEIAYFLLTAGADINIMTTDGFYPIHFVASAKPEKKTLMERFLLLGASLDCMTPDDNLTPLDLAIKNNNLGIVKLLEIKGAKRGAQILAARNKNRS